MGSLDGARASLAKSPDTQARLFADHLFRVRDAKSPTKVLNVEAAEHLVLLVQIVLIDAFENIEPEFAFLASSGFSGGFYKGLGATGRDKLIDGLRLLGYPA